MAGGGRRIDFFLFEKINPFDFHTFVAFINLSRILLKSFEVFKYSYLDFLALRAITEPLFSMIKKKNQRRIYA